MKPEIDVIFKMLGVKPGIVPLDLARRGRTINYGLVLVGRDKGRARELTASSHEKLRRDIRLECGVPG